MCRELLIYISYHFFDFNLGGGFLGIKNNALIGCMSHKAENKIAKDQYSETKLGRMFDDIYRSFP